MNAEATTWAERLDKTCPHCHVPTRWTRVGGVTEVGSDGARRTGLTFACAVCTFVVCVPEEVVVVYYDEVGLCSCGREATQTTTVPLGGKLYRRCADCAARTHPSWNLRPLTAAERGS